MPDYKKKSSKQEKAVAKDLSGKATVASGAIWSSKGDVKSSKFLVECKITQDKKYLLYNTVWDKIKDEALRDGMRVPLMNIQLEDGKISLCVIGVADFHMVTEESTKFKQQNTIVGGRKSIRINGKFLNQKLGIEEYTNMKKGATYILKETLTWKCGDLVVVPWNDFLNILREEYR